MLLPATLEPHCNSLRFWRSESGLERFVELVTQRLSETGLSPTREEACEALSNATIVGPTAEFVERRVTEEAAELASRIKGAQRKAERHYAFVTLPQPARHSVLHPVKAEERRASRGQDAMHGEGAAAAEMLGGEGREMMRGVRESSRFHEAYMRSLQARRASGSAARISSGVPQDSSTEFSGLQRKDAWL